MKLPEFMIWTIATIAIFISVTSIVLITLSRKPRTGGKPRLQRLLRIQAKRVARRTMKPLKGLGRALARLNPFKKKPVPAEPEATQAAEKPGLWSRLKSAAGAVKGSSMQAWHDFSAYAERHVGKVAFLVAIVLYAATAWAAYRLSIFGIERIEDGVEAVLVKFNQPRFELMGAHWLAIALSIAFTIALMKSTIHWFIINVPEFMALITINYITGAKKKLGEGLHAKLPWQQVKRHMWFVMEVIGVKFTGVFPTKDGGRAKVTVVFRYKPDFEHLETYAEIDEATLGEVIIGDAKRVMTEEIATASTREVPTKLPSIRQKIEQDYGDDKHKNIIERQLGINFMGLAASEFEFEAATQAILDASLKVEMVLEKGLSDREQATRLVVLGEKNVKIEDKTFTIRGDGSLKNADAGLAALIAGLLGANRGGDK